MSPRRLPALAGGLAAAWLLAACVSADPAVVARAVAGTLTAVITPTPVVVVVTVQSLPPAAVPTASPAPATPTPVLTASPTAPPTATGPAPAGTPTLSDDFSQPTGWTLAEDGMQKTALAAGQLEFTVKEPDQFRFIYDLRRRGGDFFASVAASAGACQPRDRLGLLFRVQDGSNYYQFEVDCTGHFRLAKVVADALTPLRDWAVLPAAPETSAAGPRTVAVRAQGPALEAFVDGVSVAQVTDSAFAEGAFGLIVGSSPAAGFTAHFDDFQVWTLR
ncbi:MAG: hypothetical protein JNK29_09495 [Anaerolineales bacterium]|nr:hypothetical protein [Anaerolineales bacterium]